jgi:bla regulator protein BlaR1
MELSLSKIAEELINALFTTLIASLWQGLVLAAFAGLVIIFTGNSSAKSRYNLLIGGLIVFCLGTVSTFFIQLNKESEAQTTLTSFHEIAVNANTTVSIPINSVENSHQFLDYLNSQANLIVLLWFLIVLARTIQLLTGLHSLRQLRRKAIFSLGGKLEKQVLALATKMGITACVEIAESAMVKIPMVIGHLKPLILIPIGLFTALPPSAIEAILVHELAHIRRRDYLVNLLVSLIEVLFFFNPAVIWLVSLIKAEREKCCDDIVIHQTSNKTDYIRALIACQEYHLAVPAYAMALSGHKNHLLGRVKRILSKNNQSLNVIEKSLLSLGLVIAGLLTLAFSNTEKIDKIVRKASQEVVQASKTMIEEREEVEKIEPVTLNQTLALTKNIYTTVPDTTKCEIYLPNQVSDQTNTLITNGDFQTQLLKQNGILYQINSKGNLIGSLQVNGQTIPVSEHQKIEVVIDSLQHIKRTLLKLSPLNTRQDYLISRQNYQADSARKYKPIKNEYQSRNTNYNQEPDLLIKSGPGPISIKASNTKDLAKQLADAIMQDDLVNEDVKSFKLSASELVVNGKRISNEAYQSFLDKNVNYFPKGATVYYNFDTKTTIN